MSFLISSFLDIGNLLLKVCNSYASAPEQFRTFSQEISSLNVVYQGVADQLQNQGGENNTLTLGEKNMADLKILHDGLQAFIKELEALLKRYQSLKEAKTFSFDRLQWGLEDLEGFRKRIPMHVCLLTAFNTSLMWYVHLPL
ncbi:hypothetical protein L211DRAFT_889902 [Terfezia boudieri ATCC MYA-4762]|uniref:Fungal N-terminal domain-containing protein n=1 Tax=Terfezia boudieri ATCC MYA-4762 TaxID=1051890 RepID=A0A3N4LF99_9PEZI|nr:hypothetical protein L211DRAFT_889902 [Terfezia boudieri ATCC MYA-4762]